MADKSRPAIWYVTAVASIAVGIIPIVILERWFGVPRKVSVGFGVATAGFSLIDVSGCKAQKNTRRKNLASTRP